MIYTSGSTGRPKGVDDPASGNCQSSFAAMAAKLSVDSACDSSWQKYAISFDPSVWECFAPLIAGGQVGWSLQALEGKRIPITSDSNDCR